MPIIGQRDIKRNDRKILMLMNEIHRKKMTHQNETCGRSLPGLPIGSLVIDRPQPYKKRTIHNLKEILVQFKKRVSGKRSRDQRIMKRPYVIHKDEQENGATNKEDK
jgi:hypothetical protein